MKNQNFCLNRAEFSCRIAGFHKRSARKVCQMFSYCNLQLKTADAVTTEKPYNWLDRKVSRILDRPGYVHIIGVVSIDFPAARV